MPVRTVMRAPYDAVIFDMDGVVTDTASLHAAAWRALFDEVLADPRAIGADTRPFDPVEDYRRFVDGRRRRDGVAAFLAARRLEVPEGGPDDAPDAWTVHGFAARKNEAFLARLARDGARVFPGTQDLLHRLREASTPVGLVTASRNARTVLEGTGLVDAFDVIVDGTLMTELDLPGKPDPAGFLEAARRLGVVPSRAAVVEDAVAGVEAARRGGFALVVGIDRAGQRAELEAAGADFVLDDVSELDLGVSRVDPWVLSYEGFDPQHESRREALTVLGNGYQAVRGSACERTADGVHYPGTYLAGVYNRLTSTVEGTERVDEELVNAPSWLAVDLAVGDGPWWSQGDLTASDERHGLDLRAGLLTRTVTLHTGDGRRLDVVQQRLVSMDRPHLAAMRTMLVAHGWSGPVRMRSGVDATVVNANDLESALLANRHLDGSSAEVLGDTLLVRTRTRTSGIEIATAVRTTVVGGSGTDRRTGPVGTGEVTPVARSGAGARHLVHHELALTDGEPLVVERVVAVVTSRDAAIASAGAGALAELARVGDGFDTLLRRHRQAWAQLWELFAIEVDTDEPVQLALHLHVLHLLQAVSPHTVGLDAGVPARGLHGEGYRGHVFWDELFVLPLYVTRLPAVARSLLDYRWRRLDAARHAAREAGHAGAMFPWQSGSDGRDETPHALFNPRSGRWMRDSSWRQRHVGLAVAYNAWQYVEATGDTLWLAERGAELVVEVARFFASLATWDEADGRFHIAGVMGPDEYHDGYPEAPGEGLRDSAYTNVLTAWVCRRAVEVLDLLQAHERTWLVQRLDLTDDEVARWAELSRLLAVPFHEGVISQFDGYGDLPELDWAHYRREYPSIERLDLILEAEGDTTNRYRLSKQADVLMLLYLLGPDDLLDVLADLGHDLTTGDLSRTVDHYLARTAHGSTLSRVVHTSVLAMLDRSTAWSEFREALDADLDDTQGGTTGKGVHLGAMAGTLDIVQRTFTGMRMNHDGLVFRPRPPGALRRVAFEVVHRDLRIQVLLDRTCLQLTARPGAGRSVRVRVRDETGELHAGQTLRFALDRPA